MPNSWFDDYGIHPAAGLAGLIGATVALLVEPFKEGVGIIGRLSALFVGTASSMYLAPALGTAFTLSNQTMTGAGFLLGVVSMSLTVGTIKLGQRFAAKPMEFIKGIYGRNKDKKE